MALLLHGWIGRHSGKCCKEDEGISIDFYQADCPPKSACGRQVQAEESGEETCEYTT